MIARRDWEGWEFGGSVMHGSSNFTSHYSIADKLDTCNWTFADFACSRECIGRIHSRSQETMLRSSFGELCICQEIWGRLGKVRRSEDGPFWMETQIIGLAIILCSLVSSSQKLRCNNIQYLVSIDFPACLTGHYHISEASQL